jgi:hypothetical protein
VADPKSLRLACHSLLRRGCSKSLICHASRICRALPGQVSRTMSMWLATHWNGRCGCIDCCRTRAALPHLHEEVSGEAQVAMGSVQLISQLLVALLQANTGWWCHSCQLQPELCRRCRCQQGRSSAAPQTQPLPDTSASWCYLWCCEQGSLSHRLEVSLPCHGYQGAPRSCGAGWLHSPGPQQPFEPVAAFCMALCEQQSLL